METPNRMDRALQILTWGVLAIGVSMTSLRAEDAAPLFDRGSVLVFNEENDLVVNTDRHYTQGIKFAYLHEDGHMPLGVGHLDNAIPAWGFEKLSARSGYSIGQNMYTPADVATKAPQPNDRPYAGWLYLGLLLQRDGVTRNAHFRVQESFELELGTLGSPSLARQAQTWVHEIRGFSLPMGWANQLRDEPGFRLKYERSYRMPLVPSDRSFKLELIPFGGTALGTVEDTLRAGGFLRIGWGLPEDFGTRTIDSLSTTSGGRSRSHPRNWGAHVFVGTEGRIVGRNEFLDGNLYRHSLHVDKRYLVGDALLGFNVTVGRLDVGYTHVFRSPEFANQTEHNEFGSVFARISF